MQVFCDKLSNYLKNFNCYKCYKNTEDALSLLNVKWVFLFLQIIQVVWHVVCAQ